MKKTIELYVKGFRLSALSLLPKVFTKRLVSQAVAHVGGCDLDTEDGREEAAAFIIAAGKVLEEIHRDCDEPDE